MLSRIVVLALVFGAVYDGVAHAESVVRPPLMKEPAYQAPQARYCLLTFGEPVEQSIWIAHDGSVLYADLDGDGDLTDANERFEMSSRSNVERSEFEFLVGDVTIGERTHKDLRVACSRLEHLAQRTEFAAAIRQADQETAFYSVGVDVEMRLFKGAGVDGRVQQMAHLFDHNGLFQFARAPESAPVLRFDAPWEIQLAGPQKLRIGRRSELYLVVATPGVGAGTAVAIGLDNNTLIPRGIFPEVRVTYPAAASGDTPIEKSYSLLHRCCTVNLHDAIDVPDKVGPGEAQVELSLDGWLAGRVAPTTGVLEIVTAPKLDLQPVSSRLQRELVHIGKIGNLSDIEYTRDGSKIIAIDSMTGVIQVWDAASGESVTTIDLRPNKYARFIDFHLSADGAALFVPELVMNRRKTLVDGKQVFLLETRGGVRTWNLTTGEELGHFEQDPPRGVHAMSASPDGHTYLVAETIGRGERQELTASLWDADTRAFRGFGESLNPGGIFSPDGQLVAVGTVTTDNTARSIKVFDVGTLAEVTTVEARPDPDVEWIHMHPCLLDADEHLLVATVSTRTKLADLSTGSISLGFWDTRSGEVLAKLEIDGDRWWSTLSPDRSTVAIATIRRDPPLLTLVDIKQRQITRTVVLNDGAPAIARIPQYSPDGRWLAVATHYYPDTVPEPDVTDLPQPRIELIEAATGTIRETIVCPQCIPLTMSFSPDGRTLASAGLGKVLLWDVADITSGEAPGNQ